MAYINPTSNLIDFIKKDRRYNRCLTPNTVLIKAYNFYLKHSSAGLQCATQKKNNVRHCSAPTAEGNFLSEIGPPKH